MSLKANKYIQKETTIYYYDGPPCSRGGIITMNKEQKTPGIICGSYNNDPTLEPVGMLLIDIIDLDDINRTHFYMDASGIGSKVQLMTRGWALTNKVIGNPKSNEVAILYPDGFVGGWYWGKIPKRVRVIGQFMNRVDEDGFVKLYVNI